MTANALGDLIKTARLSHRLTQDQLADLIGAPRSYVSQIETGARKWPQELIGPLAEALNLDQLDMAIAAGKITPRPDQPPPPADPVRDRLATMIRQIDLTDERTVTLSALLDAWRALDRRNAEHTAPTP